MQDDFYLVSHAVDGWTITTPEGRELTKPHRDEKFTRDRAAALNLGHAINNQDGNQ